MYKLSKKIILRKNKNFQSLYFSGKSYANKYIVIYLLPTKEKSPKVGFAAGKRLGNAVVRNRVKRLLRETYRLNQQHIRTDLQLLLVGRKSIIGKKQTVVNEAFVNLCTKAGIFDKRRAKGE